MARLEILALRFTVLQGVPRIRVLGNIIEKNEVIQRYWSSVEKCP